MKCPKCGGEQRIIHWTADQPRYLMCERCGGTGNVNSITNKEWLQSMDDKELAQFIADVYAEAIYMWKHTQFWTARRNCESKLWEKWLGENHHG